MDLLAYWYLFPVAIIIAVLAMSAGVSGSNFWIPVYLLWLNIEPKMGFWLALLTMLFGFGSGVVKNLLGNNINWYLVGRYLLVAVPASIAGALLVPFAPVQILLLLFSAFVLAYGSYLIFLCIRRTEMEIKEHAHIFWGRAALAGFLKGLIATGLGKLILPGLLGHKRIRSPVEAVGTVVMIIFVVNIAAVVFRLTPSFISDLIVDGEQILSIMIWVAPGVVIGGQLGPMLASKLSIKGMKAYVGVVLILVGLLILVRFINPL
jgi:uncharacterized membrane protein YfcA